MNHLVLNDCDLQEIRQLSDAVNDVSVSLLLDCICHSSRGLDIFNQGAHDSGVA